MITKRALRRELASLRACFYESREYAKSLEDIIARRKLQQVGPARSNRKKLTEADVEAIRYAVGKFGQSQREVAAQYGLNPATVSRIVRYEYHQGY